jgi:small subunit ribosomal protein S8
MSSNQIANFVSAISNIRNSLKYSFSWPRTKTILEILKILKKEGYIAHYQTSKRKDKDFFEIFLKRGDPFGKYYHFKIISKPSFKRHFSKKEVWKFSNNIGMFILSTPFGILSDRDAKLLGTGGKVLLYVY